MLYIIKSGCYSSRHSRFWYNEPEGNRLKIEGFIWFDDIIEKLGHKHNVQQDEVREVFASRSRFRFVEKGHRSGENIYVAMGQTIAGRYLVVFFVYRKDGRAIILSARDMKNAERKKYEQK